MREFPRVFTNAHNPNFHADINSSAYRVRPGCRGKTGVKSEYLISGRRQRPIFFKHDLATANFTWTSRLSLLSYFWKACSRRQFVSLRQIWCDACVVIVVRGASSRVLFLFSRPGLLRLRSTTRVSFLRHAQETLRGPRAPLKILEGRRPILDEYRSGPLPGGTPGFI